MSTLDWRGTDDARTELGPHRTNVGCGRLPLWPESAAGETLSAAVHCKSYGATGPRDANDCPTFVLPLSRDHHAVAHGDEAAVHACVIADFRVERAQRDCVRVACLGVGDTDTVAL